MFQAWYRAWIVIRFNLVLSLDYDLFQAWYGAWIAIRFKLGAEPGLRYIYSLVLRLDCDTFQVWY